MTRPRGLTLVELLVTVGLFMMVAAAIYGTYAVAMRAWTQAQATLVVTPRLTACLEDMAAQLRRGVMLPEHPWASGERGIMFTTIDHGVTPVAVRYEWASDGQLVEQRHLLMQGLSRAAPSRAYVWLVHATTWAVRYGYLSEDGVLAWESQWTDPEHVPQLVTVTLAAQAGRQPPITLSKTILIPTGVWGTYERGGAS